MQSVEHLTLGFSSGHGIRVVENKPHVGFHAQQSLLKSLSPSAFSLKVNKSLKKKKEVLLRRTCEMTG